MYDPISPNKSSDVSKTVRGRLFYQNNTFCGRPVQVGTGFGAVRAVAIEA